MLVDALITSVCNTLKMENVAVPFGMYTPPHAAKVFANPPCFDKIHYKD